MSVRTWESGVEKTVAGSVDLSDYDTTKIITTGLSIAPSPSSGFICTINSQVRIEHKNYYEYFIEVIANDGTRLEGAQFRVALISGFVGKSIHTHIPVSVWLEQGKQNTTGLIYSGNLTDTTLSLYAGSTSSAEALRFNIHLIRMKE